MSLLLFNKEFIDSQGMWYVTDTRCFLVCECTLILCGDLRSLFLKMLLSTFYKKCVMGGKVCMIRPLVVCTIIIFDSQWS